MCWIRAGLVGLATILIATAAEAASSVTHKQVQVIKVPKSGGSSLQSMARKSDGRLVALVGRSRYEGIGGNGSGEPVAEIHVFDKEGAKLQKWSLDFAGQAVGAGPDGSIFVGGNGKIAKYDADGKLVIQAELPHMAAILADKGSLTKQAEEQIESERKSIEQTKKVYAAQIKVLKSRIERLNKIDSDELTPSDKRRLKRYQDQLQAYESVKFDEGASEQKIEAVIQQLIQRAMMISGVSANENDVFVVCGEQKGYGFATWRMDRNSRIPPKCFPSFADAAARWTCRPSAINCSWPKTPSTASASMIATENPWPSLASGRVARPAMVSAAAATP
ncbi:MAG TPA: hypothetical protein VKU82_05155 [Planctomycetaceae bacterium]|nr:hypothetical protein [Planctomycetaceae bacterium]